MRVVKSDIWLCEDCTVYACNGDLSGIPSDSQAHAVQEGVASFGPHLVPNFESESGDGIEEFLHYACDACDADAGRRHRFAVLGEDSPPRKASKPRRRRRHDVTP